MSAIQIIHLMSTVYYLIKIKRFYFGVTTIEGFAFNNCSGLTSIKIPSSVTSIKTHSIQGCSNLKYILLPNDLTFTLSGSQDQTAQLRYTENDGKLSVTAVTPAGNTTSVTITDAMNIRTISARYAVRQTINAALMRLGRMTKRQRPLLSAERAL